MRKLKVFTPEMFETETHRIKWRKPVRINPERIEFNDDVMTIHEVTVDCKNISNAKIAKKLGHKFNVAPKLINDCLNQDDEVQTLFITTDLGPFVVAKKDVMEIYENGIPGIEGMDMNKEYFPLAYCKDYQVGWLIRLNDCSSLQEPEVEIPFDQAFLDVADNEGVPSTNEEDYLVFNEGDFTETIIHDTHSRNKIIGFCPTKEFYSFPYIQDLIDDFYEGIPLPPNWIKWNLAYLLRTVWFLQQSYGQTWVDYYDEDLNSAFELSVLGENNIFEHEVSKCQLCNSSTLSLHLLDIPNSQVCEECFEGETWECEICKVKVAMQGDGGYLPTRIDSAYYCKYCEQDVDDFSEVPNKLE